MRKEKVNIVVHPDRMLIKVTKDEWNSLFSIWIDRPDGSSVQLFTDMEEEEGYEKKFKQNVSVGTIIAVGDNLIGSGPLKGDIAIIDYLVTGNDDNIIGIQNGHRIISIVGKTTYHEENATPYIDGKMAWFKGDFDVISPLIGYVRHRKVYSISPYIILKYENQNKMNVSGAGILSEETEVICQREVIASGNGSAYKEGDKVILKESDLFFRTIDNKQISVIFENDVLAKA